MNRAGVIVAGLALLVGCARKNDDRICLTPPGPPSSGDWNACIHRWAYRLATSPDDANTAARATVAGCWSAMAFSETQSETGAVTPGLQEAALRRALFYVVQARAGHCAIPE